VLAIWLTYSIMGPSPSKSVLEFHIALAVSVGGPSVVHVVEIHSTFACI